MSCNCLRNEDLVLLEFANLLMLKNEVTFMPACKSKNPTSHFHVVPLIDQFDKWSNLGWPPFGIPIAP